MLDSCGRYRISVHTTGIAASQEANSDFTLKRYGKVQFSWFLIKKRWWILNTANNAGAEGVHFVV